MVWTCPWYEGGGDGAVNERGAGGGGLREGVGGGGGGPGKCATDYYEKSSLKKSINVMRGPYSLQHYVIFTIRQQKKNYNSQS